MKLSNSIILALFAGFTRADRYPFNETGVELYGQPIVSDAYPCSGANLTDHAANVQQFIGCSGCGNLIEVTYNNKTTVVTVVDQFDSSVAIKMFISSDAYRDLTGEDTEGGLFIGDFRCLTNY